jgi:hypothetical protein
MHHVNYPTKKKKEREREGKKEKETQKFYQTRSVGKIKAKGFWNNKGIFEECCLLEYTASVV